MHLPLIFLKREMIISYPVSITNKHDINIIYLKIMSENCKMIALYLFDPLIWSSFLSVWNYKISIK